MKTLSQLLFGNNKRFFVTTCDITANIMISFAMSFKTYIFNLSIKACRESFLKYYVATLIWQMGSKQIQRTKKKNLRRKSLSPFNLVQINILFIRFNITFTWSVAFVWTHKIQFSKMNCYHLGLAALMLVTGSINTISVK